VEFFCSPEKLKTLVENVASNSALTYIAVNSKGETQSNIGPLNVNAVTWGVFPGKEVIQPTVVDPVSFMVWKDEAFQTWDEEWASLYPEGDTSTKVLTSVSQVLHSYLSAMKEAYIYI
jgi:methylenetetrahydrofolate reductase (NADPH)